MATAELVESGLIEVQLGDFIEVGEGPRGIRLVVDVTEVNLKSDRVNATLAATDAADWGTVSDNGTGVFAAGTSGPAFMNVIIYDNTTELDGESGSTYTIDYSDIKGGSTFGAWATGSGNIDSDPLFVGNGSYHLQEGSPCINTGNPGVQYYDTDGSRNDMGAYGGPGGDWNK